MTSDLFLLFLGFVLFIIYLLSRSAMKRLLVVTKHLELLMGECHDFYNQGYKEGFNLSQLN